MDSGRIKLEIVTPYQLIVSEEVDVVVAPGADGEFGVLYGHAPLLTTLKIGVIKYQKDGAEKKLSTSWGFVEVTPHKVIILVETAELAEEIDYERALRAKERAEEKLRTLPQGDTQYSEAKASYEKALMRVIVSGK